MELNKREKLIEKKLRRVGRGHGSGRGKTAGRGTKGQKARGKVLRTFEGGALPLVKRLPFLRGRGRNKILRAKPYAVKIDVLNSLPTKSTVDVETLVKNGIVREDAKKYGVKIIGNVQVKSAFTVKIPVSKSAKEKIEAAGGTVAL